MSEMIKCDYCGKDAHESDSIGWVKLERIGIDVLSYGEEPGPWHFDVLTCLWDWTAHRLRPASEVR